MIGKPSNQTAGGPAFLHHGIPDLVVRKIIAPITQEEDAFQELFDRKAITAEVRAAGRGDDSRQPDDGLSLADQEV